MTDVPEPREAADLEELLAPVLDLPSPAQPAALAEICLAHPDRAEALRGRHAILCRFGLASEDGRAAVTARSAEPRDRFGPFRILQKLGRGGMGVVFLAEDPELGRQIALKLIRPEYLDSERARERFKREVGVAARLDHPGICTVYGTGEVDGQPYLALQYLRGETLEVLLRGARAAGRSAWSGGSSGGSDSNAARLRPVALRPALELVEQLARAVHCAHEAGLVHRDLKPGNVMVAPDGRPVLMDFGLAREADSSVVGLTGSGELVGTPIYMAPEQVAPKGRPIDRRTDVHALGVILYECLTLRPPHAGADREELYHRILTEEPVELRRLQPIASRDLATVVHRAMAKDPARRYPSALAFAEDLRRVLDGEPTVARPPGRLRRAWVEVLRHRTVAAVGAALLVGTVASLWFSWRSLLAQRRFEALAVVARAKEVQPEDPELAYIAMREALELAAEPEVIAAIHGVLPDLQPWTPVRQTDAHMESVVWSPSRRLLVVNAVGGPAALHGEDGSFLGELGVVVDDVERPVKLFPQRPALAFAPDGSAMWASVEVTGPPNPIGICRFELGASDRRFVGKPPASGQPVFGVQSIAWSQDGHRLLVTRGNQDQWRWWASVHDADTGKELVRDIPLPPQSRGCAFLEDGTLVLPSGLWSPEGKKLCELEGSPKSGALMVLVAKDRIALASMAGVKIYSTAGDHLGGRVREDHRMFERLHHAEWSPQQDSLVLSFQDGEVWLFDRSGELLRSWNVGSSCHAHFMLDGRRIVTGDSKGRVILWDRDGHMLDRLHGHRHNAHVAPLNGGDPLVVSWDGRARIWHLDRVLAGLPFRSGYRRGRTLAVGNLLVATNDEGRVQALTADGAVHASTTLQRGQIFLSLHADQRTVWLTEFETGALWRWDPLDGTRQGPFAPDLKGDRATSTAHLQSGRMLLATGWEVRMRWFDPERGETSPRLKFKATHVAAPGGGRFAVAVGTHELGVVAPTEVKLLVLAPDGETVLWSKVDPTGSAGARASALTVSGDGRYAVVGFQNGEVSVWDLDAQRPIARFADHTDVVLAVAIAPGGRHVASSTRQGHLCVRELGAERPSLTWRSSEERLQSLSFVDDHTLVSTGSDLERLRWWWWEPDRLREVLARLTLPPLDVAQRRDLERLLGR